MYGFATRLHDPVAKAVERVTAALKAEGFGVLTTIDVQATLKAKLGLDRRPYVILGACNPAYASRALDADPEIGLLLPCNVVVREDEQGVTCVSFMDPAAVLGLVERPGVEAIGIEVRERLKRVRDALATQKEA